MIGKEDIKLFLLPDDLVTNKERIDKKLMELTGTLSDTRLVYKRQSISYTPSTRKYNSKLRTHYHLN
jgi:hypothetical protein